MSTLTERTRVVLHHPFFPENVGSVARAMRNFGFGRLEVAEGVDPRHPGAYKLAVASGAVLEAATHHDTLAPALADASLVFGTTCHPFPHLRMLTPREAAAMARQHAGEVAIVFGNEKNGLAIGELRQMDAAIRIPGPVMDASLNLAQAATVICYEWLLASLEGGPPDPLVGWRDLADAGELAAFGEQVDESLRAWGFYKPHNEAQRRSVLRRVIARLQLDREEVSVLRGLVSKLGLGLAAPPRSEA